MRMPALPRAGLTLYVRYGRGIEAALLGVAVGGLLLAGLPGVAGGRDHGRSASASWLPLRGSRESPGGHPHLQRGRVDHRGP